MQRSRSTRSTMRESGARRKTSMRWHWLTWTANMQRWSIRSGFWTRSGVELACVALLFLCGQSWAAELSIRQLDQQPYDADVPEFFPLGTGDLLLRIRGWRERKPPPTQKNDFVLEPWTTLYVLAPGGQVKERVELPYGIYQVFAPLGNG